jgi:hypothetical protein
VQPFQIAPGIKPTVHAVEATVLQPEQFRCASKRCMVSRSCSPFLQEQVVTSRHD